MTLQELFGAALVQRVGPVARAQGFRRSRRVWRKASARGDWAAFDVQSSQWNTADSLKCVVNVGAAPAPWLDFWDSISERPRRNFAPSHGIFQTRISLADRGGERWWQIEDESQADTVAADIADRMLREGFPLLEELLDRDRLISRIREGRMGYPVPMRSDRWLAVVLADGGPTTELDEALNRAASTLDPTDSAHLRRWCVDRAARAAS